MYWNRGERKILTSGKGVKNIMGVNGAKTTPSALSSSMLPYLLGELLSKANGALTQPIRSVNTTQAEHRHYERR